MSCPYVRSPTPITFRKGLRVRHYKIEKKKYEKCGSTIRVGLHHIDRDKSNNDPNNLIPLCWRCHQLIELITIGRQRSKFTTKSTKRDLNKIVRGFKWVGDELVYKDSKREFRYSGGAIKKT